MKKYFTFLFFLLAFSGMAFAQSSDTISLDLMPFHYAGGGAIGVQNLMRQHDGSLVSRTIVSDHINSGIYPPAVLLGTVYYKFTPTGAEITDSLFVPADNLTSRYYMLHKDPLGEGNLRVCAEPDGEGGTNLRISHFPDDDFFGDPSEDMVVPLCDVEIHSYTRGFVDDDREELIWSYYIPITDTTWEGHVANFSLDGTLNLDAVTPEVANAWPLGIFSEHPLKYYQWDADGNELGNLSLYVYNRLFQMEDSYLVSKNFISGEPYVYFEFNNGFSKTFVIPEGDDLLVAAPYSDWHNSPMGWPVYDSVQRGVAVAKYDLHTMQQKGLVMFNDYPGPYTMTIPMCLFKSSDGCLYFVYRETAWDENQDFEVPTPITAVKMDHNLNVLWTRYIETPKGYEMNYVSCQVADEDEEGVKIAVVGLNTKIDPTTVPCTYTQGLLYFSLFENRNSVGVAGNGIVMRPYCFYPNPVKGELRIQFSPDVQPAKFELYDLQGRLVRVQSDGLESVDMSRLTVGTYMMRITLEDGTSFSDKLVKE